MPTGRRALLLLAAIGFGAAPLAAQSGQAGGRAFALEALGGTLGSAAGFGLGVLAGRPDACDGEDIRCVLERAAVAVAGSAAGSAVGAWGTGRLARTGPSGPGAVLGALAGVAAGLGLVHLVTEEMDTAAGAGVQLAMYAVAQGVVTALGSRLLAAFRD